jgi:hypothetical protein
MVKKLFIHNNLFPFLVMDAVKSPLRKYDSSAIIALTSIYVKFAIRKG